MTLISYRGRDAAMAGRDCFYLAPHIAQRPDGDPVKTFVCYLALYARDVLCGQLPGEPSRYFPTRAERYARACLIPARAFIARADRTDAELAEHFNVPLEQITARRAELALTHAPRTDVPAAPRRPIVSARPRRHRRRRRAPRLR